MKISIIGLGKLGLPTAYTFAYKNHDVMGFDINSSRFTYQLDSMEAGINGSGSIQELFDSTSSPKKTLCFTNSLEKCVLFGDIIFVAIQTPHQQKYEGTTRLTEERDDFDYQYLIKSIGDISKILNDKQINKTVCIISTVLPGTIRRDIFPIMSEYINLCYNPYFIAMGTVVRDLLEPEFILLGCVNQEATQKVIDF